MKKILVFGNPALNIDNIAFRVADMLREDKELLGKFEFENCYDLSQVINLDKFTILDTTLGIKKVKILTIDDLEVSNIISLHDFDLAFFLKLKKELGTLDVKIIGVPQEYDIKDAAREVKEKLWELEEKQ